MISESRYTIGSWTVVSKRTGSSSPAKPSSRADDASRSVGSALRFPSS